MRGVRLLLLLPAGGQLSLLGGLPCGLPCCLLTLLGSLSGGVLRLLSCTSGSILGLSRDLACLLSRLSSDFLGLPRCLTDGVLCLLDRSSCGLLGLSGYLSDLICDPAQGSAALLLALLTPAGQATNGILHLLGRSSCKFLGLSRNLPCLVGRLSCYLACLLGRSSCGFLCLSGYLTGGVLRLLGHPLRDLLHLLLGLLDGLAHRVFHSRILGRLIHRTLDLRVGVDHLLDLGLSVTGGKLLRVLLELLAVVLDLALYAAHRLPVETLGFLQVLILVRLLLAILRLFGHSVSFAPVPFTRR
jgi:hypothetical protein